MKYVKSIDLTDKDLDLGQKLHELDNENIFDVAIFWHEGKWNAMGVINFHGGICDCCSPITPKKVVHLFKLEPSDLEQVPK